VLKRLRELAQIRAAECCEICRDLDNAIERRDVEFFLAKDLWKFVSAIGRVACRVTVVIGSGGQSGAGTALNCQQI
jgi:hypothetical protein